MDVTPTTEAPDFEIEDHGSIVLIRPKTEAAHEFAKQIGDSETMHYGDAIVVEPCYVQPIIDGAEEAGLTVGLC